MCPRLDLLTVASGKDIFSLALPSCGIPGWGRGQLCCSHTQRPCLHLLGDRNGSSTLVALGPSLTCCRWQGVRGMRAIFSAPMPSHGRWGSKVSPPVVTPKGLFICAPGGGDISTVLPRRGSGPALLNAAAYGRGQCQFSHSDDVRASSLTCHR